MACGYISLDFLDKIDNRVVRRYIFLLKNYKDTEDCIEAGVDADNHPNKIGFWMAMGWHEFAIERDNDPPNINNAFYY
jgi:hypothetical protein